MYCVYKYITYNLYVRHIKLVNYIYNLFTNTHTHIYICIYKYGTTGFYFNHYSTV